MTISITITSDPVCPWCYIGYRRLTKAIHLYQKTYPGGGQEDIRITWKPYFLDRDAPMQSILYTDRMIQKLGQNRVAASQAHLQRLGKLDGIQFRFGGKIGNTIRAHQLIFLSEQYDIGRRMITEQTSSSNHSMRTIITGVVEGLFRTHFEEEGDITDVETLIRIVRDASADEGLDEDRVRECLVNGEGIEEIDKMAARARTEEKIQAVPYFRIGGIEDGEKDQKTVILDGTKDVEEFLEALIAYKEGC